MLVDCEWCPETQTEPASCSLINECLQSTNSTGYFLWLRTFYNTSEYFALFHYNIVNATFNFNCSFKLAALFSLNYFIPTLATISNFHRSPEEFVIYVCNYWNGSRICIHWYRSLPGVCFRFHKVPQEEGEVEGAGH